ncbi:PAS domain-containing sensor histidine kinase [Microbacterium foliorum]|uniref:histidine kinase n=1 Tax=Microbacterium foliorum TaxID=104336 RepID=A0A0F0KRT2_9MICO|nr:ATP-binding protein [Microbacterium foliorum]AXL11465.1 PAS domain-containing sensor histidine kinase [Microbacterium foliorum]KJL23627.1 Sensor histidine kinase YycG [Microbacterium foliorum]
MRTTALVQAKVERGWRRYFDDPTPLMKQAPTAIAVGVAAVLVASLPGSLVTYLDAVIVGVSLVGLMTVLAAVLSARGVYDGWVVMLVPMIDLLGIGALRAGTGGATSMLGSLVLLPVIWIAAAPGFRQVFIVAGFTSIALLMPYLVDPPVDPIEWLRGIIGPFVFATVGAIVNEMSRLQRLRTSQAEALVTERTAALVANQAMLEKLSASEQQYRTLSESFTSVWNSITGQAVIAIDSGGMVSAWNPGAVRLLGLSEHEALAGVRVERFLQPTVLRQFAPAGAERAADQVHPGLRALFDEADAGLTVDTRVDVSTAAGSTVPARVTLTSHQDTHGSQHGYLLVITDETRAVEVARMKDQFVGMISHELRTPLSAIIGFLDLLQNDPAQPLTADQQEFVDIIERNAQRLLNLVGDLLFTAQVDSGRFPLERRETDVVDLVREAVASSGPHAQREGIDITAEVPDAPVWISVDAGRIGQALDNLLSNAIKFTGDGGRVSAAVRVLDGTVELAVRDTGVGIPEDEQGMLFTRFFRASTATRNAVPGVGLGLTITRAIVLAHGGSMEVASSEGVGTEFRMLLPATPRTEVVKVVDYRE